MIQTRDMMTIIYYDIAVKYNNIVNDFAIYTCSPYQAYSHS